MLTRLAILARFARSEEDSLCEPNHIDIDHQFVEKKWYPISVAPYIFRDPNSILLVIYLLLGTQLECAEKKTLKTPGELPKFKPTFIMKFGDFKCNTVITL